MGKYPYRMTMALCTAIAALTLAACGGSASGVAAVTQSAGQSPVQAATDLSGVAAAGAPVSGTVYLSDASFPTKTVSAVINRDGTFSFSASALKTLAAPYLIKAVDGSGKEWFSFAGGTGTANVNPITTLALAMACDVADLQGLSDSFDTHNAATLNLLSVNFPDALARVRTAMKPLLSIYGASDTDPLAGFYAVNQQGLDGFLDQVDFAFSRGAVTVTDRTSNAPVFSGPLNLPESASVTAKALSAPKVFYLPGNAVLTLAVQGSLPSGTLIKNAEFTLQLPLGITVDQGASGINTAVAIEAAAHSNIYPVPALSQTDNQLKVTLSSLDGFGAGNFLAVRCVVGSATLLAVAKEEFTVSAATFYADIYKNQRLKGLSIAPVSLVFPAQEGKTLFTTLCASCHNLSATDTTTASLFGKSDLVAARATSRHHGVVRSATQVEYFTEYLTTLSSGRVVY